MLQSGILLDDDTCYKEDTASYKLKLHLESCVETQAPSLDSNPECQMYLLASLTMHDAAVGAQVGLRARPLNGLQLLQRALVISYLHAELNSLIWY